MHALQKYLLGDHLKVGALYEEYNPLLWPSKS